MQFDQNLIYGQGEGRQTTGREPRRLLLCDRGVLVETRPVPRGYVGLFLLVHRPIDVSSARWALLHEMWLENSTR
ncbi:MAG: hypothetical protein INR62_10305 [Rhodospirillales bacterium]|nr:hypothetical protein [Acetobacter sp.]